MIDKNTKIVCVAIKSEVDGTIISIPRPARHHDVIRLMVQLKYPRPIKGEQGFLTNAGEFVNRIEAKDIAFSSGQITSSIAFTLTSEDLW
jgi:hypothetical protein